ncbi:tellurite resistance protein [Psychromonas sp. RZ22]|uniref:tellurite resistance protein n=1 Tax=Psychromonas algarum TaxID=2555643 RepID=UPI001067CB50|nr:tellurite resistance protein [Psychromonas sp. RZ22]TEW55959.1 tellurite resistance protein [Psychromonas sp. RZ22]
MQVPQLLQNYAYLFDNGPDAVLDLACGKGQNGLYLQQHKINTIFADINEIHIDNLINQHAIKKEHCWCADFESASSADASTLSKMKLQGIIVFRYLHRPLFQYLKKAIKPGGVIIYETFTEQNKAFGRPHREAFLLKKNELKNIFSDWEIIFYFEGIKQDPDRAIAQIVCRKPNCP